MLNWRWLLSHFLFSSDDPEADPEFRALLRRILHRGLLVIGGLGIFATLIYVLGRVFGAGLPIRWGVDPEPTIRSVVLIDKIAIALLCGSLLTAAALRCSLQAGRMMSAFAIAIGAGISLYGDVTQGSLAAEYVTLYYMLAVGAIPFNPRQALGLGIFLTALTCTAAVFGPLLLEGEPAILRTTDAIRLGVATLLLSGISALLYESRRRQYRARQEAEELYEEVSRLEEAKSRFFANLTHELKSPLTLILGPIDEALDGRYGDIPEAFRQRLAGMRDQARRLRALVRQLLRLSELEEEKMTLNARPISLAPFLKRMASLFQSMADRRNVDLRVKTDDGSSQNHIEACVDPGAFRQIVSNLLSNALSHTPEGGTVRLKMRPMEDTEDHVSVSVRDSGPGLSEEMKESLFDRYAGTGTGSNGQISVSTGIGLALVKELTERHGGTVEVESERDFGTEVIVKLPASPSALPEEDLAEEWQEEVPTLEEDSVEPEVRHVLGPPDGSAVPNEGPSRLEPTASDDGSGASEDKSLVLVVDDEAPVRSYLSELLTPRYRTVLAENGKEALRTARETSPDLVISDVAMPELDGFELCETLRQDDRLQAVPIILLTVQKEAESRLEGFRRGADAYLDKPFRPAELRQRVENLIEVRRYLRRDDTPSTQDREANDEGVGESESTEGDTDGGGRGQDAERQSEFLREVRSAVEDHLGNSGFGVKWLADEVGLSSRQLQRRLQDEAGLSAGAYIRALRLRRAAELLEAGEVNTVKEAAEATGYRDPSHFSRLFKEAHGRSPSAYKSPS